MQFTVNQCGTVAERGFFLDPNGPAGRGTSLGHAALDYGFNTLGLHKISGQVLDNNLRSLKFHARLGFKEEGVLRSHHLSNNGYQAVHLFGMLATEWRNYR